MIRWTLLLPILLCLTLPASAEWSHDIFENNPVDVDPGSQSSPCSVPDGEGGVLVVYTKESSPGSADYDLVAQRLDAEGIPLWGDGLTLFVSTETSIGEIDVVPDGDGGAFIAFYDHRTTYRPGYALHIDNEGSSLWGGAVRLTPNIDTHQLDFVVTGGSDGSCLVAWRDYRFGETTRYDLFAQKISAAGGLLWSDDGATVCVAADYQDSHDICSDGDGGAFVVWRDPRNLASTSYDIYGNHIDADGSPDWSTGGYMLDTSSFAQNDPRIVPSRPGSGILVYHDSASGGGDIKAVMLHESYYAEWLLTLTEDTENQYEPVIVSDGRDGAFIAWRDGRENGYDAYDYYAQWVDLNGGVRWTETGVALGLGDGSQQDARLCAHPEGGLVAAWNDQRMGTYENVYAQRLDADGGREWGYYGLQLSNSTGHTIDLDVVTDDRGGAIAVWNDERVQYDLNIYAQRVDRWGDPGDPAPTVTGVVDYPQDQGGVVRLDWSRSYLDDYAWLDIDHYSLWRRYAGIVAPNKSDAPTDETSVLDVAERTGLPRDQVLRLMDAGWAYETDAPAYAQAAYSAHVPSYGDSTAAGTPQTEYKVIAHEGYSRFWESNAMAGWSVDNLSPSEPLALAAQWVEADARLDWSPAVYDAEDLHHYRVYRGDLPGFEPGPATFVDTATDTTFTEAGLAGSTWYFRVTAVDVHGNEGPPSNETALTGQSAVGETAPARFALHGAWPNPFNPSTRIAFDLSVAGHARLVLHDARGRIVRTLVDEHRGMGRNVETWDGLGDDGRPMPSGLYFARLESGGDIGTLKLLLAR